MLDVSPVPGLFTLIGTLQVLTDQEVSEEETEQ